MLELWGCLLLIYGIYIPPAVIVVLYKPQLLSIWLICVCLASLPLFITSGIYVQVYSQFHNNSTTRMMVASEQTVLLVLSVINVCLQWITKVGIFIAFTRLQHTFAQVIYFQNVQEHPTRNNQNNSNSNSNSNNHNSNIYRESHVNSKLYLTHEVVFWSQRYRTLPLSMVVGSAFGFVSVIANASTPLDVSMQVAKFDSSHLSSYDFDICPQLPSLVHVAMQTCLLSLAHIAWGAMAGQVTLALSEIGVRSYWRHYIKLGSSKTWETLWQYSTWHPVDSPVTTTTTMTTSTNIVNTDAEETNTEIFKKEHCLERNVTSESKEVSNSKTQFYCKEDERVLQREEIEALQLESNTDLNRRNQSKVNVDVDVCSGNIYKITESTCQNVQVFHYLKSSATSHEELKEGVHCEQEEQHQQEQQQQQIEHITNTTMHHIGSVNNDNEDTSCCCSNSSHASNSVFAEESTHKLIFALIWLVCYVVIQLLFTILPIFYHRHGAFDMLTMRESNRTGCVVTLPLELVLVTISYIGLVWLVREEEVRNEIE